MPLKYPIWLMAKLRQFSHFLQQINKFKHTSPISRLISPFIWNQGCKFNNRAAGRQSMAKKEKKDKKSKSDKKGKKEKKSKSEKKSKDKKEKTSDIPAATPKTTNSVMDLTAPAFSAGQMFERYSRGGALEQQDFQRL